MRPTRPAGTGSAGYAVMLDLAGRDAVVVGGGPVGTRRALGLLDAGARVRVVAPSVSAELESLAGVGGVILLRRRWRAEDLDGAAIAVAATGDPAVDAAVAAEARARRVPCGVAGNPAAGDLTVPATLRRGGLVIAVSTSGAVPGLAGALRRRLGRQFGEEWALLVEALAGARRRLPPPADERAWDDLLDDAGLTGALQRRDIDEAREQVERILTSRQARSERGSVYP